ncbi:hypothetical protein HK102_002999 [Quaeritorhiza haematococci]|nr:hypothetical protein HK102_002999 [Quaeritorhiza haematococci]
MMETCTKALAGPFLDDVFPLSLLKIPTPDSLDGLQQIEMGMDELIAESFDDEVPPTKGNGKRVSEGIFGGDITQSSKRQRVLIRESATKAKVATVPMTPTSDSKVDERSCSLSPDQGASLFGSPVDLASVSTEPIFKIELDEASLVFDTDADIDGDPTLVIPPVRDMIGIGDSLVAALDAGIDMSDLRGGRDLADISGSHTNDKDGLLLHDSSETKLDMEDELLSGKGFNIQIDARHPKSDFASSANATPKVKVEIDEIYNPPSDDSDLFNGSEFISDAFADEKDPSLTNHGMSSTPETFLTQTN